MFDALPPPMITADGPVLIFGGCYSNLQATTALLEAARGHGIPPARIICTGDAVAYGADPQACADLLRDNGIATVMGNCEEQLAVDAADCGCGFTPGSACERLSAAWFTYARTRLSTEAKRWMASLPHRIDLIIGSKRLAIVHGAPSRINRFVFASDPDTLFDAEIAATGCDGVIAGHCGLGFTRTLGKKLWHNAGVIGLPANDGTPRGWYSILTPQGDSFIITTHPLTYDQATAAAAMRQANSARRLRDSARDRHLAQPGYSASARTGNDGDPAPGVAPRTRCRCRAGAAGNAVVQHRHAVQSRLRGLLHRKQPAQRPAGLFSPK